MLKNYSVSEVNILKIKLYEKTYFLTQQLTDQNYYTRKRHVFGHTIIQNIIIHSKHTL